MLNGLGYRRVGHYAGGIKEWLEYREPIESGPEILQTNPIDQPILASVPQQRSRTRSGPRGFVLRPVRPGIWVERVAALPYGTLLGLWLGMVLGLGCVYWLFGRTAIGGLTEAGVRVPMDWSGLATALYFSFVTATSIGFGDVVPVGLVRLLAVAEGAAALLVFSCVVSKLLSRHQEELAEETHRIAYEERLGRVRINLHLVLAEMQAIETGMDARAGGNDSHSLVRLESAALVFAGELRTVHDLLYRPQQQPEESVIEGMLANLTADLDALRVVLGRLPAARQGSPLLVSTVRMICDRAAEICGDCVPRQYAPELKVWMDRIQSLARDMSASA